MVSNTEKAAVLVEALPFIRRYHGKTVVIKYGGSAMVDEKIRQEFIKDVVLMKYVGIHPVIVHGGGPEINQMLERVNKSTEFIEGLRISDKETVELAEMVLSAKINKGIAADIQRQGGKAIGLSGKDGRLITARKKFAHKAGEQIDIGFVGEIESINPDVITTMARENYIPVISSIGMDEEGNTYNINADYVAGAIAAELNAFRLFFLTDVDGIMMDHTDPSTLLQEVTYDEVEKLIDDGIISGGMLPKVRTCLDAIDRGVKNVIILNGKTLHAILLEVFTAEGAGTLIKEAKKEATTC
ncbi:acetylglutamate kinase [Wohlfahrtiimonas chitiniclastica]|uniref:acetylglutamate kinase n=1 Tax=Wohlfahrtiimonas chitiniclastica TaxID=400946 RepID=UPI00036F899E|nr:acetylglutamate kinase [Wohlfahrtiimonas chitiniclastica]